MLTPDTVARAFAAACRAELAALKPGNVHVFSAGHGMTVAHFERAAAAAAPVLAAPALPVGARIAGAVAAALDAAGCNANLGIVLLAAPLAAAALSTGAGDLRRRLDAVLSGLDVADAQAAFRAIAAANPGGLGAAPQADVRAPAAITLRAAMGFAADRDSIARQYVTGYRDVFETGVPALAADPCAPRGVEAAYLALLAALPDSHIARKFGPIAAMEVQIAARDLPGRIAGLADGARHDALLAFDADLKARGLNPGTTADLTVASIFAALLAQSEAAGP